MGIYISIRGNQEYCRKRNLREQEIWGCPCTWFVKTGDDAKDSDLARERRWDAPLCKLCRGKEWISISGDPFEEDLDMEQVSYLYSLVGWPRDLPDEIDGRRLLRSIERVTEAARRICSGDNGSTSFLEDFERQYRVLILEAIRREEPVLVQCDPPTKPKRRRSRKSK